MAQYEALGHRDQGQIRELYLRQVEKVSRGAAGRSISSCTRTTERQSSS